MKIFQTAKALVGRGTLLFATVLVVATIAPQILSVNPAAADDGGYPWVGAAQLFTNTNLTYDWGYNPCPSNATGCMGITKTWNGTVYGEEDPYTAEFRNCTSYAAWKINQYITQSFSAWGNASNWHTKAPSGTVKSPSNYTPVFGDLALWDNAAGGLGHVAFVSSDSGNLYEYNSGYPLDANGNAQWGLFYSGETIASRGTPSEYIHFSGINNNNNFSDGTYLRATDTGGVYVMAGGAPMHVSSWSNVGGVQPYTNVDVWVLTNQLRQYPLDGTYIRAYTTGGVYVVAGGAPMHVSSWSNVGGVQPYTNVDIWVISNQLRQYPIDGTYIRAYTTGGIYVIAGGAPIHVSSWTTVGGPQANTNVDVWVLANQLRQYPLDGTYVRPYGGASVYEAAGGAALSVSGWPAVGGPYPTTVIPSDSLSQFLSYPQDGTYVIGYQSGEEFEAMSGAVTRITTTPLPSATSVDDWAIVNQLGGVE